MACGIPVVSSGRGALRETLGEAAWILDPQDDERIADSVVTMISNPELRRRYVRDGFKQSARFNWERAAQATLAVYREVGR